MSEKEQVSRQHYRKNKKQSRQSGGFKHWFKRIIQALFLLVTLAVVAGGSLFVYYVSSAPDLTEEDLVGAFSSDLLDKNGEVFYTIGAETRNFAAPEEIPDIMVDAVIAIEDQRFKSHFGIDPIGIGRAAVGFVTNRGQIVGGGSTVTQQLVKLSVFSTAPEDQTLERKAQEAWLAVQLERQLSKEQIMTMYLNRINLGGNIYGVAAASEHYFGKPASDLEIHEAALFAGMAQAPNRFNPRINPDLAERRRNIVIRAMQSEGMITEEEADQAINTPVTEGLVELSVVEQNDLVVDSFVTQVRHEIREKTGLDISTAGLTIETNLDMEAQQRVFDVLNSDEYVDFVKDNVQSAVSLVEVETGKIRALGGARNPGGLRETNHAMEKQTTGSTIKPLTTYGPAIEFLQYSTYHQIVDEEYTVPGTDWTPRNFDRQFRGQMSLRDALVESRNIPAAKIMNEDLETSQIDEFLGNLGIDSDELNDSPGIFPQNAINGEMTPLQLAGAYAAFSNGGNFTQPHAVTRVTTRDGQEINLVPETNRAMSDYTAYMITDILRGVPSNLSSTVGIPNLPQAGKTGTTNFAPEDYERFNHPSHGVPDSWYVGYTSNYSLSVWTGFDRNAEGNYLSLEDGSRLIPRHIYREVMSYVSQGLNNTEWTRPSSVTEVAVEDGSDPAQLPGPNTPDSHIVNELFVTGTEPTEVSTSFGEELDAPTGLSAEYDEDGDELTVTWDDYELENEDEDVTYNLTIDGESTTVSDTEFSLTEPPAGTLTISLSVSAYGNTGPEATTSITIPEREDEEDEDEDEDDEEETEEEPDEPEEEEPEEEPETDEDEEETEEEPPSDDTDDSDDEEDTEEDVEDVEDVEEPEENDEEEEINDDED